MTELDTIRDRLVSAARTVERLAPNQDRCTYELKVCTEAEAELADASAEFDLWLWHTISKAVTMGREQVLRYQNGVTIPTSYQIADKFIKRPSP